VLSPETNLYARVATGFRAASIYPASGFGAMSKAGPESVTSYEAGVKSEFWERRARLSANVFSLHGQGPAAHRRRRRQQQQHLAQRQARATGRGFEFNLDLIRPTAC
jgi:iron complex outermembrane receptor protein